VQSPVSGESARLIVQIFETNDALADETLLKAVAGMLKRTRALTRCAWSSPMWRARTRSSTSPRRRHRRSRRSIRAVLRQNGHVRLTGTRLVA
jgi:hypothetical protein